MTGSHDPRYDGLYQRGGADAAQGAEVGPRPAGHEGSRGAVTAVDDQQRVGTAGVAPGADSAIREVGAEPGTPQSGPATRNPFDVWVWAASAALVALGAFFVAAPLIYAETEATQVTTYYSSPWFNYTVMIAPPLILVGVATAVVQLFVLSIRHTLGSR